jgi:hypothetical protein
MQRMADNTVLENCLPRDLFCNIGAQTCYIITKQWYGLFKVFRLTTVIRMEQINGHVFLMLICSFLMIQTVYLKWLVKLRVKFT